MSSRQALRQKILQQRSSLSAFARRSAAKQVAKQIVNTVFFLRSQRIAFYLPANGELDPLPIINRALKMRKKLYLSVLHPLQHNRLYFMPWRPNDTLIVNRYGILEPKIKTQKLLPPWSLDLVLAPLVAFDLKGNRLGMGGGYYDRTFGFIKQKKVSGGAPHLVGLAYEFQKVNSLPAALWDVPLATVITEKNIYRN